MMAVQAPLVLPGQLIPHLARPNTRGVIGLPRPTAQDHRSRTAHQQRDPADPSCAIHRRHLSTPGPASKAAADGAKAYLYGYGNV